MDLTYPCRECGFDVSPFACTGEGVCPACINDSWITYLERKMIEYASEGDEHMVERCAHWLKVYIGN